MPQMYFFAAAAVPNDFATLFISFVSLILLVVLLYIGVFRKNRSAKAEKQQGRDRGKEKVVNAVRSFARQNQFRLISPAPFARNGENAGLDAVVVGYFGVLGVISLGYNGTIYGDANDESWVQVTDDKSRRTFQNPIREAALGVRTVRDALFGEKLKKVPVEVLYVFCDEKVQLALPRSVQPMTLKDFKALLKKDKYQEDCGLDMDKVENALRAALAKQPE